MSDDLIARLKAAHKAASLGPLRVKREIGGYEWVFDARDEVVMEDESGDLALYVLTRNALPEIIEALEERERMREVVEAARILLGDSGFLDPEYSSDMYPDEYHALSHALDALEEKS